MYYIVKDLEQDFVYTNIQEARYKCIKLGYNKFRDNFGGEYFI